VSRSDSYGGEFGRRLNAHATSFVTRTLPKTVIAVTELKYSNPQHVLSTPPTVEDAYLVGVHLKNFPRYEYWENDRAAPVSVLRSGEAIVYDIKRRPTFHLNNSFHSVHFYLPRMALDALADEVGAPRIDELHYKPGVPHADRVLRGMAEALLPLFQNPDIANSLLMDHVMVAVGHHVASRYGGMRLPRLHSGGLTPLQERRVKDLLRESLSGKVSLAALANSCSLSPSQFNRAFRKSVGMPPHKWLVAQRFKLAKELLRNSRLSLVEIGLTCGFSDQSHFTRSFTARLGVSPGMWRKNVLA
jgi:AraC family transcriptional regulator